MCRSIFYLELTRGSRSESRIQQNQSGNSRRRHNNPYGVKGFRKCLSCVKDRKGPVSSIFTSSDYIQCIYDNEQSDCHRCVTKRLPCGPKLSPDERAGLPSSPNSSDLPDRETPPVILNSETPLDPFDEEIRASISKLREVGMPPQFILDNLRGLLRIWIGMQNPEQTFRPEEDGSLSTETTPLSQTLVPQSSSPQDYPEIRFSNVNPQDLQIYPTFQTNRFFESTTSSGFHDTRATVGTTHELFNQINQADSGPSDSGDQSFLAESETRFQPDEPIDMETLSVLRWS